MWGPIGAGNLSSARIIAHNGHQAPCALGRWFQGQNAPKKMRQVSVLDQWVEVEIQDGKAVTNSAFRDHARIFELR